MRTLTIYRNGQIRLPLLDRKRDFPVRTLKQAVKACRQAFDQVDIDRLRNQVRHLLPLEPTPPEKTTERWQIIRDYKWHKVLKFLLKNKWQLMCYASYLNRKMDPPTLKSAFLFPHERMLSRGVGVALIASVTGLNAEVNTPKLGPDMELVAAASSVLRDKAKPVGPKNWLDGVPESNGFKKDAITGPYKYAKEAGYAFAQTDAEVAELVKGGTLVPLKGPHIRLRDVHSPYVLPIVNRFANRLATQYAEQGCGKLDFTSATRSVEYQKTLGNGHLKSVHPAGMTVDIERLDTGEVGSDTCLAWLSKTLLFIEGDRRIDVTFEKSPRHFHLVVVPHTYEAWLAKLPKGLDPEVKWLATALYFEAAFNESMEGYRAIGWVIRNRVRSKEFPDTIVEVVTEGSAGRSNGGCQFSFTCDGKAEKIQTLCTKPNSLMSQFWLGKCEERWEVVVNIAKQILAEPESADPTGGAVLYYATWMSPKPNWVVDMKKGTIRTIGSHVSACSVERGDDACRS